MKARLLPFIFCKWIRCSWSEKGLFFFSGFFSSRQKFYNGSLNAFYFDFCFILIVVLWHPDLFCFFILFWRFDSWDARLLPEDCSSILPKCRFFFLRHSWVFNSCRNATAKFAVVTNKPNIPMSCRPVFLLFRCLTLY